MNHTQRWNLILDLFEGDVVTAIEEVFFRNTLKEEDFLGFLRVLESSQWCDFHTLRCFSSGRRENLEDSELYIAQIRQLSQPLEGKGERQVLRGERDVFFVFQRRIDHRIFYRWKRKGFFEEGFQITEKGELLATPWTRILYYSLKRRKNPSENYLHN